MYNKNVAYDFPLQEEIKRQRKRNVVKFPGKKELARRQLKAKLITVALSSAAVLVSVGAVTVFINGQIKLTELTEQTTKLSKELKESENLYTQLAMRRESSRSLDDIAQRARNELGMDKSDVSRAEYINIMSSDKGEVNPEHIGFFERVKDMFFGLMS